MLNLEVNNIEEFKKIFESIKELDIIETNLVFNDKNVFLENMDTSHTSLIFLKLQKDYFKEYKCDYTIEFGLNIIIFCKILKACNNVDKLIIQKQMDSNQLDIIIKSNEGIQEFFVPEIDILQDNLQMEDNDYNFEFLLTPENYSNIINNISIVEGNDCNICYNNNKLEFSSSGDLGKTKNILNETNYIILTNSNIDRIYNSYSTKFLKRFIKSCHISKENIKISITNNYPIKLTANITNNSYLKYYIAPKDSD